MRLWNLAALLLPLALSGTSPAAAQAPAAEHDLAANAALKYWQAFDLLPTPDEGREKLLEEWDKAPLDAAALKRLAASEKSLMYLHRGAKLRRCDWSLDYEDGPDLLLPHLAKARTLARLAALHARHEFEQGRPEAGIGRRDGHLVAGPPRRGRPHLDLHIGRPLARADRDQITGLPTCRN